MSTCWSPTWSSWSESTLARVVVVRILCIITHTIRTVVFVGVLYMVQLVRIDFGQSCCGTHFTHYSITHTIRTVVFVGVLYMVQLGRIDFGQSCYGTCTVRILCIFYLFYAKSDCNLRLFTLYASTLNCVSSDSEPLHGEALQNIMHFVVECTCTHCTVYMQFWS
jgi:hypothetical protein